MIIIDYILRAVLINELGACVRYLYLRFFMGEHISYKYLREGKIENEINKESIKNSICGFFFIVAIITVAIIIVKLF